MNGRNLNPSRLPGLAERREHLLALKRKTPDAFSAEHEAQLDEVTTTMLTALSFVVARLADEVRSLRSKTRRT